MAKTKKVRSPNFPSLSLERALELSRELFDKYGQHAVPVDLAIKAAGYSPKSSGGRQVLAALSYYGLLDSEGAKADRKVKLTDLAFKILMDKRPVSPERENAIRNAATKPSIFWKIIEQFPDQIPAEDVLEYELVFTYKFNPSTVQDFIIVFKETMDFAKVYEEPGNHAEEEEVEGESQGQEVERSAERGQPSIKSNYMHGVPSSAVYGQSKGVESDREIANYPAGPSVTFRIFATGEGQVTRKSIRKLIKHLEIDIEDFPEDSFGEGEKID